MTTLSEQDYQQILTFLQKLYTHLSFDDFANFVGESIPRLIAAEISVFGTVDFGKQQVFTSGDAPTIPDMEETFRKCFHEHPFVIYQLKTFDFSACKLSDFWTEKQLHQSEAVYYRFMRYLNAEDVLSLSLLRNESGINAQQIPPSRDAFTVDSVSLFRGERSFTERDRSILNLLQPHLMQARQTAQVFSKLQQQNQHLHSSLNAAGSIVISKEGRIQLMTRKAEQWLRQYFPVKQWGQSLPEHLQRWVSYQQSLFSRNGTLKTRLPLKVEQDGKQLTARLVADPTQDQYLLLLEEQQQPKLSLEDFELLGLSKREAEVLYWVAKGKENPEIARLLYIGVTTVRKHLEHIYQKLGVKTRAAAVVEALKRLGMLHCE